MCELVISCKNCQKITFSCLKKKTKREKNREKIRLVFIILKLASRALEHAKGVKFINIMIFL